MTTETSDNGLRRHIRARPRDTVPSATEGSRSSSDRLTVRLREALEASGFGSLETVGDAAQEAVCRLDARSSTASRRGPHLVEPSLNGGSQWRR